MDPMGPILVRVCANHTYLSITPEGSVPLGRWLAWSCDAIDFFSVSLSVTRLQKQFNKAEASTIVRCLYLACFSFPTVLANEY